MSYCRIPPVINEQIKNVIDLHTEPWGTQLRRFEIKDIELPDNMQRAMAREAEAERERRAKNVAAEGEYQAAVKPRRGRRYHHGASGCVAAPHPADHGENLGREEFHHHLPAPVHDDGAGGDGGAFRRSRHRNSSTPIDGRGADQVARLHSQPATALQQRLRLTPSVEAGDCH